MSIDRNDKSAGEANDHGSRDVPKLVKLTKQALETSVSHRAKTQGAGTLDPASTGEIGHAQAGTKPSRPGSASLHDLPPTAAQGDRDTVTASGGGKRPVVTGLLLVAVALGVYLLPADEPQPRSAPPPPSNQTAVARETPPGNAVEEPSSTAIHNRVGRAELYRQHEEALAEAQREEQARLAAELEARRKAEQARVAAELAAQRKAQAAKLAAGREAAQQAERRKTEQARLAAEAEAARRAAQQRVQAAVPDSQAITVEEPSDVQAAAPVPVATAAAGSAVEEPVPVPASGSETADSVEEARFTTDPCQGATAKFLSTCR